MQKKFKLLIFIDDDVATNFYHKIIVQSADVCEKFLFFEKAADALVYFEQINDATQIPDAIFLDINMPKMNGWMFLEKFTKIKLEKDPPVIMLTTSLSSIETDRASNNERVYKLLNKSLTEEHLMALSKELLSITKSADEMTKS